MWPLSQIANVSPLLLDGTSGPKLILHELDVFKPAAITRVSKRLYKRHDILTPDHVFREVAARMIGAFSGRIMQLFRDTRGLGYTANGALVSVDEHSGGEVYLVAMAHSAPEAVPDVIQSVRQALSWAARYGPDTGVIDVMNQQSRVDNTSLAWILDESSEAAQATAEAVSYTHLTLPTICSV